jgi:hypothetical protein
MHISRWSFLVLATLILNAAAGESGAQSVAYQTQGTGSYSPATGDNGGLGVGTHLGRQTFSGNVATSPTADPLVFDFVLTVPQETVAADGDTLLFSGAGQVQLIPLDATSTTFVAIWEGDFVVEGGRVASPARSRPTSHSTSWRSTIRLPSSTRSGRSPGS